MEYWDKLFDVHLRSFNFNSSPSSLNLYVLLTTTNHTFAHSLLEQTNQYDKDLQFAYTQ